MRPIFIILLLVCALGVFMAYGNQPPNIEPGMLVYVFPDESEAAEIGLMKGDLILSCDGKPVLYFSCLKSAIVKALEEDRKSVRLIVNREGEELTLDLSVNRNTIIPLKPPMSPDIESRFKEMVSAYDSESDLNVFMELSFDAEKEGDLRTAAWLSYCVSLFANDSDEMDSAKRLADLSKRIGDELGEAIGLVHQMIVQYASGDLDAAKDLCSRAVSIYQKLIPKSEEHIDILECAVLIAKETEDWKSALEYYEQWLKILEAFDDKAEISDILFKMAKIYENLDGRDNLEKAVEYYERAFEFSEATNPSFVADYLRALSVIYFRLAEFETAEEKARRSLEIYERYAPNTADMALTLNVLGLILEEKGQSDEAEAHFRKAIEIQSQTDSDTLDLATFMDNLASLLADKGEIKEAEENRLAALEIRERLAPDSLSIAVSLNNLGLLMEKKVDLQAAVDYMRRSIAIRERLEPDTREYAAALSNLGSFLELMGNLNEAQESLGEAFRILQERFPDSPSMVTVLGNLGSLSIRAGDYKSALNYYNQALALQESLAPGHHHTAVLLNNIAIIYSYQRDREAQKEYLERSLAILEAILPDSSFMATTLINLAVADRELGDPLSAERRLKRALQITNRIAPDGRHKATILMDLSVLAYERDDLESARQYTLDSLELYEKLSEDIVSARILANAARTAFIIEKDLDEARHYAEKAISIARERNQIPLLIELLQIFAAIQAQTAANASDPMPETEKVLKTLQEAVEAFESVIYTDNQARENVLERDFDYIYKYVILWLLKMDKPEEALEYLDRSKSKAVLDALNVESIRTGDEALTALLKEYAGLQARLRAQQRVLDEERKKPEDQRNLTKIEQLTKLLAETKAEFYQVVNRIRSEYGADYAALVQVEPMEFSQIQKELPPGAVVIEYFPAEDKLFLFIVTRDSFMVKEHAVLRERLDTWVQEVRDAMADWKDGIGSETPPDALVHLYANIIKPAEDEIKAAETVIFVPSGSLCYLPFAALAKKDSNGELRYLAQEDQQIVMLSRIGLLSRLLDNQQFAADGRSVGTIAFGNPTGIRPELPHSEEEVRMIEDIYPDSRGFVGDDATEWRVKLQAQYGQIVHFATHATLRNDDPNESYIALAGCDNEDGRLTMGEIFGLPLEGTRLVVLSACETAIAYYNPGREISSIAQAFAIAGAPTIIASLWSVNDKSTGQLMERFYRELANGKTKAQALQSAQRSLIADENFSHPFFWAGFTLLGAWE